MKQWWWLGLVILGGIGVYLALSHIVVSTEPTTPVNINQLATNQPTPTLAQRTIVPAVSWAVSPWLVGGVVIGLVVAGLMWLGWQKMAADRRDDRRRQDLQSLVEGFERYKQKNGHYPISLIFDSHYYSLVNLANDWSYYGLPEAEVMKEFVPAWPVVDPLHPFTGHDQTNQYVYYPHDSGQSYQLFAHLEAPKTSEAVDCNERESIPLVMGRYNYQVTPPEAPTKPVDQPIKEAGENLQ